MLGPSVDVELFGEPLVRRRLLRVADNLVDHRDAFKNVAVLLEDAMEANFATDGVAGGESWPALAESTVQRKLHSHDGRTRANARNILRATGLLEDSLQEGGPQHIQTIRPDEMRWGSRVPYGKFHQSRGSRSRLPARRLGLSEITKQLIVREVQKGVYGS